MVRITFSWDDGSPDDFKIKDLFEKYDIPCILFIPAENIEGRKVVNRQEIRLLKSELLSIGSHTLHHIYLTNMEKGQIEKEVLDGKKYIEDIISEQNVHFCLPGGKSNSDVLHVCRKYFKTIRTADTMNAVTSLPLIRPTFHYYNRGIKSLIYNGFKQKSSLLRYLSWADASDYFAEIEHVLIKASQSMRNYDIHIWGHSWEIEEFDLWGRLEKSIVFMKERGFIFQQYYE